MLKILTVEQISKMTIEELISLYSQGYKLSESFSIYPNIDDILPHSNSKYKFASK